ncbi:hypothetical protein MMC12_002943 [Toensbergia leucococca]|nr:hypothetical protein [Toensbergia leucococca]
MSVPKVYTIVFKTLEPLMASLSAIYLTQFDPLLYLQLTHSPSAPVSTEDIPLGMNILQQQLGNMMIFLAFIEAAVLRATDDLQVWRVVVAALVLADLGHLYSMHGLGTEIYWNFLGWGPMEWGNIGSIYAALMLRVAFLCGLGLTSKLKQSHRD